MTPSLFQDNALTGAPLLKPEDFDDITCWRPLPPVAPEVDSNAWEQERIPVCCFDGRKWARKKNADLIVSCSGPAEFWSDEPGHHYGYCAYHWTLRQHKQLFSGHIVPNPLYTERDRARDQAIIERFWEERVKQGLSDHSW